MNQLQNCILDVYKEFKRICDLNGLKYYAIGGTCIGAVRHKGFIPWDDDVDIGMPFEDYEKFREIVKLQKKDNYEIYDYRDNKFLDVTFLKLYRKDTTFIEKEFVNHPSGYIGVFIDIMPVTYVPDNFLKKQLVMFKYMVFETFNKTNRLDYADKTKTRGKVAHLATIFCKRKNNYNFYSDKVDKLLKECSLKKSKKVAFHWRVLPRKPYKNIFPSSIFDELIDFPFEDTSIFVPSGYDEFLTLDFGDYMTLPPEEKRIGVHNNSIIDLEHSYIEYAERKNK